jgi:hypothetical protein
MNPRISLSTILLAALYATAGTACRAQAGGDPGTGLIS